MGVEECGRVRLNDDRTDSACFLRIISMNEPFCNKDCKRVARLTSQVLMMEKMRPISDALTSLKMYHIIDIIVFLDMFEHSK